MMVRNAVANSIQMLLGSLLLFALYKCILAILGVDKLGIWSVVLATASFSRLADFGLGAGVTKFVARYLALNMNQKAAQVVETGILVMGVAGALILSCAYPFLKPIMGYLFSAEYLSEALDILPYALISLWLTIVGAVSLSGLDGCQRMVPKAFLTILSQCLLLLLAYLMMPDYGLKGLAWAQISQGVFLLVGGWFLLRGRLKELHLIPSNCNKVIFNEMLRYGLNIQAANLFILCVDPLTKIYLTKFGGPESAGYFEIANQVVIRVRSLIVAANQAIIPKIAELFENEPEKISEFYCQNIRILATIAVPIYSLLLIWSGIFSQIILNEIHEQFIFYLQICSIVWLTNTFTVPAYFSNMGTGFVGLNTLAHILMGTLNLLMGWMLGMLYGAPGVVYGYSIAIILSSMMFIGVFQYRNKISTFKSISSGNKILGTFFCLSSIISFVNPGSILTKITSDYQIFLILSVPLLIIALILAKIPWVKVKIFGY